MVFRNLDTHNVNRLFTYYCPGVMHWESIMAHEHGHCLGYLIDQYMFNLLGVECGDLDGLEANGYSFTWLFTDPEACYQGNVMYYCYWYWGWKQSERIH